MNRLFLSPHTSHTTQYRGQSSVSAQGWGTRCHLELEMQSHIPSLIRMAQAQPGKLWGILTAGVPSFLLERVLRALCREQYCPLAVRDQNWKSRSLFLFLLPILSVIPRAIYHSQSKGNGLTQFTKSRPESSWLCLPCLGNDSCRVWSVLWGSEACI